jgi:hypothetical protein
MSKHTTKQIQSKKINLHKQSFTFTSKLKSSSSDVGQEQLCSGRSENL